MDEKAFKGEISKIINRLKKLKEETPLFKDELDIMIGHVKFATIFAKTCDIYGLFNVLRKLNSRFYYYVDQQLVQRGIERSESIDEAVSRIGELEKILVRLSRTLAKFVNDNCLIPEKRLEMLPPA